MGVKAAGVLAGFLKPFSHIAGIKYARSAIKFVVSKI